MFAHRFRALALFSSQCRRLHETHYDILKVSRNCTKQDVRKAFIKLSKKYHPDVRRDKNAHNKYVKIVEAYKTLSEPNSRVNYDLSLNKPDDMEIYCSHRSTYSDYPYRTFRREHFYANSDSNRTSENSNMKYKQDGQIVMTIFVGLTILVYVTTILRILNYEKTMKKRDSINRQLYYEAKNKANEDNVFLLNEMFDEKDA